MKSQAGFTLVEALVAGTLSTMIPVLVIATLHMNGSQLQRGTSRIRLTQIYDLVTEEIYRRAYVSGAARPAPCAGTGIAENCGVLFTDVGDNFQIGFRVRLPDFTSPAGILEVTTVDAATWAPFLAGPDTVWVWTDLSGLTLKATGLFSVLNATGPIAAGVPEGVRANLRLFAEENGDRQYLSAQTEMVICRNASPPPYL